MNDPTSNRDSSPDWQPCPPGTLGEFCRKQRRARMLKRAERIVEFATVLVIAVTAGWFAIGYLRGPQGVVPHDLLHDSMHGGISCRELKQVLPEFVAGTLSEELNAKITLHLAECPRCVEAMDRMKEESASVSGVSPPVSTATVAKAQGSQENGGYRPAVGNLLALVP